MISAVTDCDFELTDACISIRVKWVKVRGCFVQENPEREQVRSVFYIGFCAAKLLGSKVPGRADASAVCGGGQIGLIEMSYQTKINDHGHVVLG